MKKIYSSPVIALIHVKPLVILAGSANGGYDSSSIGKENEENMARQYRWDDFDDEF